MCILFIRYGPFWQPWRPLQPPNSLGGQIWLHIWNLLPKLHILPFLFGLFWPSFELRQKEERRRKNPLTSLLDLSASLQVKSLFIRDDSSIYVKSHDERENQRNGKKLGHSLLWPPQYALINTANISQFSIWMICLIISCLGFSSLPIRRPGCFVQLPRDVVLWS